MELIYNNQFSIFEDIFHKYLSHRQCTKFYSSTRQLYNIYLNNSKFENNHFTPKEYYDFIIAINMWFSNKRKAILTYGHISLWNTIFIKDMSKIFRYKYNFNDDISDWDTKNVINMEYMFDNALQFNQNLNNWNISNVKKIRFMFNNAIKFDLFNCIDWDLSNITQDNKIAMNGNI